MTDQHSQVREADGRYRTLLELTAAIDKETNLQVVLKSLHKLLSAVIHFDSTAITLLTKDARSLRLVAFERGLAGPNVDLGAESPWPDTASQVSNSDLSSAYIVPISTPRRKLGALCFGRREEGEAGADEIALLEAVASHVGTALESALESDAAESRS